jgi:RNase P protein component
MRTLLPNIASNLDLILIARPGLATATLEETRQALRNVLGRAQIYNPSNES